MKINSLIIVFIILSVTSGAQSIKLSILPEDADISLTGHMVSSPVKINENHSGGFIVVAKKGYATHGKKVDDILKEPSVTSLKLNTSDKLPEGTTTKKIEFSKLVDLSGKRLIDQGDAKYVKSISKTMSEWGFNMVGNQMFEEKGDVPDFIVAGEVLNWGFDTRGSGFQTSVIMSFSVYNTNQKKVVYTLTTGGFTDSKKTLLDQLEVAFSDGIIGLITDPDFQNIVISKSETTASSGTTSEAVTLPKIAATTYSSYGDMVKGIVGSVVTIKTNFGHGSGFVVSKSGFALTNYHVISGASSIEIIFDNGFTMECKVVSSNEDRDVALLKISGSGFKPLAINSSLDAASIGTEVIAVGTPADIKLGQTVTKGIISGKRELEENNGTKNVYLQSDVSINAGNSGGPLINSKGEVIGIVVAKVTGNNIEGLGFAVPISEALEKLNMSFEN